MKNVNQRREYSKIKWKKTEGTQIIGTALHEASKKMLEEEGVTIECGGEIDFVKMDSYKTLVPPSASTSAATSATRPGPNTTRPGSESYVKRFMRLAGRPGPAARRPSAAGLRRKSSATRSGQPVAASACSTSLPGWRAVSTSAGCRGRAGGCRDR